MMLIGEDPRKAINEYSRQFQSDFLKLLRIGYDEKKVNVNHFNQEYIAYDEHVYIIATRWPTLTEFTKFLGREGICCVEEEEADEIGQGRGLMISWIDNSPGALRGQDALRKKERQEADLKGQEKGPDQGNEDDGDEVGAVGGGEEDDAGILQREKRARRSA